MTDSLRRCESSSGYKLIWGVANKGLTRVNHLENGEGTHKVRGWFPILQV